jgi:DNA-binding CsgD family transcriptional regulator
MVLSASVAQGGNSLSLSGVRNGGNVFTRAHLRQAYGSTGWSVTNCTVGPTAELSPVGDAFAQVFTDTTAGNSGANVTMVTTAQAQRSAKWSIWLKRGTKTGNVTLRLRDGAGTEVASQSFAITTSWAEYKIAGLFGVSPAANITGHVDPDSNSTGTAATIFMWGGTLELGQVHVNAYTVPDVGTDPAGGNTALRLVRIATGNHYVTQRYADAALAGRTFTASVYVQSDTLPGTVALAVYDGAGAQIGVQSVTPSAAWQRLTVTVTLGASPGAYLDVALDPGNDAGSPADGLLYWGLRLEPAASATEHADVGTLRAAFAAGAAGYVVKSAASSELITAITTVMRGERYIPPSLRDLFVAAPAAAVEMLSVRQRAVLEVLARGLSNKEAAAALGISERTVGFHKLKLRQLLGVHSILEMMDLLRRTSDYAADGVGQVD